MSFGLTSVTQETSIDPCYFLGNRSRPVTIIDTNGIVDPNLYEPNINERNEEVQKEILRKLSGVDGINLFVICWNGANPRFTASLKETLRILQDMFGYRLEGGVSVRDPQEFWRRCVISYSRVSWDESSIRIRKKQMESEKVEYDMRDTIAKFFGPESRGIECVYIDALYDENDETQLKKFNEETEKLYNHLLERDALSVMAIPTCRDNKLRTADTTLYPDNERKTLLHQESHANGT